MPVTFVLGRAGAGKTRHCLDGLLAELERPDGHRRLLLLVPEQASFQMERALATRAARGGYWRAEVLSFSRLAQRVLGEVGGEAVPLRPSARALALRCAARRMGRSLHFYRGAAQTPGFYRQLDRLIETLLLEQVTPDELLQSARQLEAPTSRRKVAEISRLYREYLDWLGPQRLDPSQRLDALRARLEQVPWLPDAAIWVDGFAGFTGQELATLLALARTARDVTITLLLDPASPAVQDTNRIPEPLHLFQRTELTYQRLWQMLGEAGVEVRAPVVLAPAPLPRFADTPPLARLEAGLATPIAVPLDSGSGASGQTGADVTLLECTTHRDELRQAARFVRQRIVDADGALRFRDFAVIARDLEPLAPIVADVFAEFDIPYFLDRRRPLRSHPVCRLSEALLEAVTSGFSVAAMTQLLRTGLLPLTRAQAEELENTAVAHSVHGVEAWRQPAWRFGRELFRRAPGGEATGATGLDRARLRLVGVLEPLLQLAGAEEPSTGAAWTRTLHDVLEALGVRGRIESWIAARRGERAWEQAETHRLAWETLCALLEDVHDVLGDTPLRADELAAILGSALREQTLGLAPPTLDRVLVSEIERSRHPDVKYAWVLALNEGVFPARPADDELLTTAERDTLTRSGLPAPASHREEAYGERLLAYIACTRPSRGLTLSFATVGADGSPLLPSPLLDDVRRSLPELRVQRAETDPPPPCLPELARGYLRQRSQSLEPSRLSPRYERLCDWIRERGTEAKRLDWLLRGRTYRNAAEKSGRCRPAGEGDLIWSGSPSEVETWLDCPFKHFAKYGLRLDPARGPRPASWDLGSLAHEILADVTRRAMREPGGVRRLAIERWQALLHAALDDFRQRMPADLSQRRPELAFLSERLAAFLGELVAVHAGRWQRGQFEPLACEQQFEGEGPAQAWPALELRTAGGQRVRLRGKIDRIDRCRDGDCTHLLVYDYKTQLGSVGGTFLTGARLQLFNYLLAVQQALAKDKNTRMAGVFLAPLYPDVPTLKTRYAQAAAETEQRMYLYRPRGMFTREVAALLDSRLGSDVSPVAAMRLKKDGDFDRNHSRGVVEQEELAQRLDLARRTVLQAAEGIGAGVVAAAPLVEGGSLACLRCEFQPLCRFDRALNQPRAAEATLPTLPPSKARETEERS